MRKFIRFSLFAAVSVLLAGPASAELWNIDFDTGLDANGNEITFESNTIFSYTHGSDWQRYDGQANTLYSPSSAIQSPTDGGIPGSGTPGDRVNVTINNVYNGGSHSNGFVVGFDSSLSGTRDRDLEDQGYQNQFPGDVGFNNQANPDVPATGYGNILIIQSHETGTVKHCGGQSGTSTHKAVLNTGVCSDVGNDPGDQDFADDEAGGGDIVFEFDREVTLIKMNYFDFENGENSPAARVKFAGADNIFNTSDDTVVFIPTVPDNGVGLLTFNGDIGIKAHKMMVWLPGSGAIDNIMGDVETTTSTVSEPGVLALFGVGLVRLGIYRRRYRRV